MKEILKLQVNEDRTKLQASSRLPERSRLTIGGGLAWSFWGGWILYTEKRSNFNV